jgi:hypothetical protein
MLTASINTKDHERLILFGFERIGQDGDIIQYYNAATDQYAYVDLSRETCFVCMEDENDIIQMGGNGIIISTVSKG